MIEWIAIGTAALAAASDWRKPAAAYYALHGDWPTYPVKRVFIGRIGMTGAALTASRKAMTTGPLPVRIAFDRHPEWTTLIISPGRIAYKLEKLEHGLDKYDPDGPNWTQVDHPRVRHHLGGRFRTMRKGPLRDDFLDRIDRERVRLGMLTEDFEGPVTLTSGTFDLKEGEDPYDALERLHNEVFYLARAKWRNKETAIVKFIEAILEENP
jgi:hypothetical protein